MYRLESNQGCVVLASERRRLRIAFASESIARITYVEGKEFSNKPSLIVVASDQWTDYKLIENPDSVVVSTPCLRIEIDRLHGSIRYLDAEGGLLLREPDRGGRWLTPKPVFRNVFAEPAEETKKGASTQSIDGARADAEIFESVFDRDAFEAKLELVFAEDEALFGLGSHEEGYGNLRGRSRELYQQNMKAVVPFLASTKGYGILMDCTSLMTFHDDAYGSSWWADTVDQLDFHFIYGPKFDGVTQGCHRLTGHAPLPPKWMFGYVQSKERYVCAQELLDIAREYRRRQIPLDTIVLDWKSWPNGVGWGQKSLDARRFPDPATLTKELHAEGVRLMVSIWPIMTGSCPDQRELLDRDLMLGNGSTYDAFREDARACYWEQAKRGLFDQGVDAWWCDCTEPFEADWAGSVKPEPQVRLAINTSQAKRYLDPGLINAYSLVHSQGIYEGQRAATSAKRVVNLTRSSYAGQHRYGTITWNGDICATWETLRRCIPEGVNFCVTGEPYWSTDIGGFFIANDPKYWFWRGEYNAGCRGLTSMDALEPDASDNGCTDLGYWELYTRWLQYGTFLPLFRSHGTDAPREIWRFGEEGGRFYDTIAKFIRLRYRLIPYLYSLAAQVTFHSRMMLRALALEFPSDVDSHDVSDQFLLGVSLLVCPVTCPMYFGRGSEPLLAGRETRPVYLPAGADWYDFWTGTCYVGGRTIEAEAPLETMPLFVRAGSILPMTEPMQYVDERSDAPYELRVYRGADARFSLYEDSGDGYAYEQKAFAWVHISWNEALQCLTLSEREGEFPELSRVREFEVVFISDGSHETFKLIYTGDEIRVSPKL